MNEIPAQQRQQLLAEPILMGLNRLVVAPASTNYRVPGVYIEEIPSGVNG